jgi:hypothetical protein
MGGMFSPALLLFVSAGLAFSGPVFAKPSKGDAREVAPAAAPVSPKDDTVLQLQDQGDRAMLDMRYVDALSFYEQVRALDPADVGLDYSIARAHQMLGEFPEALTALERFEQRASVEQKARVARLSQLFTDLRSRVSVFRLRCNQAGARVLVRDRVIGTTPLPISTRLAAGAATVQIELEGFFPVTREVILPGGGALDLEADLHARSRSALLLVETRPAGATVFVDGQRIGTSSPRTELVVDAGSHQVTARRESYEEASVSVVLPAGSTRTLTVSLEHTTPVTQRWWFWSAVGLAVAGGVAVSVALVTERAPDHGTLAPGQVRAPLEIGF